MSASYSGMDPQAIHDLGAQLKKAGADLDRLASTIDARTNRADAVWRGPDVQNFQQGWNRSMRPGLMELSQAITGLGQSAQNNADEQERASSGGGLHSAGGAAGGSRIETCREPGPTRDFLFRVDGDDEDGVRIQYAVDENGEVRLIVSISGTRFFDLNHDLSAANNLNSAVGESPASLMIQNQLRELARERGFNLSDAHVMLVGYSQGGLIAEDVAREGHFGSTLVITAAAPRLPGSHDDIDVLRLGSPNIGNMLINTPTGVKQGWDSMANRDSYAGDTGLDISHDKWTAAGLSSFAAVAAGGPIGYLAATALGVGEHTNYENYRDAADVFDGSGSREDVIMRQKISSFEGLDYQYDSDRMPLSSSW